MLNFSPEKLFLVAIIALVVLGPHRLPQAAHSLGRFLAQLRHMSSGFQEEVRGALSDPIDAFNSTMGDFRPNNLSGSVRQAITDTLAPPSPPTGAPPVPDSPAPAATGVPVAPDDPSLN